MLTAARSHYRQQQRIAALGVGHARRVAPRGSLTVARTLAVYQLASIGLAEESATAELDEQGIDSTAEGALIRAALVTDTAAAAGMLDKAANDLAFEVLVSSLIRDAGHTAGSVTTVARRAATGHIRAVNPPSCARCAVLAGRIYRYSQGFQRHPRCDCVMTPTNERVGAELVMDPLEAFRNGQIRGLSQADAQAIEDGADIGQVVNVRREGAGVTLGSSVIQRAGRPTPFGIYATAGDDRDEAIRLLRRHGYLT